MVPRKPRVRPDRRRPTFGGQSPSPPFPNNTNRALTDENQRSLGQPRVRQLQRKPKVINAPLADFVVCERVPGADASRSKRRAEAVRNNHWRGQTLLVVWAPGVAGVRRGRICTSEGGPVCVDRVGGHFLQRRVTSSSSLCRRRQTGEEQHH